MDHPDVLGACLSGAGPSVLALAREGREAEVTDAVRALYDRLGVPHKIRALTAHQPGS
jgi:homoserine kinase